MNAASEKREEDLSKKKARCRFFFYAPFNLVVIYGIGIYL